MRQCSDSCFSVFRLLFSAVCFLLSVFCPLTYAETYRGVYHVHSEYSHDSKASLKKIIHTAKAAGLDFAVVTDHNNMNARPAYEAMKINPDDPKLFFGVEVSAPDGHVILLGVDRMPADTSSSKQIMEWSHGQGGSAMLAHPVCIKNPWRNWDVDSYDGLDIYNFAHEFYPSNKAGVVFGRAFLTRRAFLKGFLKTPYQALSLWDEKLKSRRVAGLASVDAHIHMSLWGMNFENLRLQFESSTLYVSADELSEKAIFQALKEGRLFVAFEALGDARNFRFEAVSESGKQTSGDTVQLSQKTSIHIQAPKFADIRLIHNGKIAERKNAEQFDFEVKEKGFYRAEVYKDSKLWIFSNPIYVE